MVGQNKELACFKVVANRKVQCEEFASEGAVILYRVFAG